MEALEQIAAQLGLDHTFFYLFGLIFVLYALLSMTYLRPFQRLLGNRKKNIDGVKQQAGELSKLADQKVATYRERLKGTTELARQYLRESEETGRREESKIVGDASTKAKERLQLTARQLDEQQAQATKALEGEISGLAEAIAGKVLGQTAQR